MLLIGLGSVIKVKACWRTSIRLGRASCYWWPKPETANERVIGEGTKLMAGAGGLGTAAKLVSAAPGIAGNVSNFLASNPLQQVTSAAGSGLAGALLKKLVDLGGSNCLPSIGGGLVGGGIPSVFDATKNAVKLCCLSLQT